MYSSSASSERHVLVPSGHDTVGSPSVQITKVSGDALFGKLSSGAPCRLSVFQQSSKEVTKKSVELSLRYLYTLNPDFPFVIFFSSQEVGMKPYMAISAECEDSSSFFMNYYIPEERICIPFRNYSLLVCNRIPITISDVIQTKDSCIYVSLQYGGEGDVYVLNRITGSNIPKAENIINEGIYLGR